MTNHHAALHFQLARKPSWRYDSFRKLLHWEARMKTAVSCFVLLAALAAGAQVQTFLIPAGTPEDAAIQKISAEADAQKRLALWQGFVTEFAANPQAAAYGNSQLAQLYGDQGDGAKAMAYGEKALAAQPNNMDVIISMATVAQKMKSNDKMVEFAVRGGIVFHSIANQPKPEGMAADEFAAKIQADEQPVRPSYEYLEAVGFNALVAEDDAQKRLTDVERFTAAFPNSRFQDQLLQVAAYTLGSLKDTARMASFAQKALAANPNSVITLVTLAAAFVDTANPADAVTAETYARKAIDLSKTQTATDPAKQKMYSGLAHSILGYSLLKQDKAAAAIPELKSAADELKGTPDPYAMALYRLGYAYGKINKMVEAKAALTEAASIPGPNQQPARDLLAKIEAAPVKKPPTRKK
jgi:tetratricopeptide (TPR) repeat protein